MEEIKLNTPFTAIYDSFLSRVTDDMYMELTEVDTFNMLQDLLVNAIPRFEFPRVNIFDYTLGEKEYSTYIGVYSDNMEVPSVIWTGGTFNTSLSQEEINILSLYMLVEWFEQQLAITDNTREKYSGADFKFTSQANHMKTLSQLIDKHKTDSHHMQRLYKRRIVTKEGEFQSTMGSIMEVPSYGYKI